MGDNMREDQVKNPRHSAFYYIKKGLHFVTTVIMYVVLLILILVAILYTLYFLDQKRNLDKGISKPPLFNAYVIISPSMVPTINVEDAIIIKRVDEDELKKGDIITFNSTDYRYSGVTVTHRIVGIETTKDGKKLYTTKGDNNNTPDSTRISYENIYGKAYLRVPMVGYLQYFLVQSSYGWIIAVVIPCLGIIIYDIIKLIETIKRSVQPPKKRKKNYREKKLKNKDVDKDKRRRFK